MAYNPDDYTCMFFAINMLVNNTAVQSRRVSVYLSSKQILPLALHGRINAFKVHQGSCADIVLSWAQIFFRVVSRDRRWRWSRLIQKTPAPCTGWPRRLICWRECMPIVLTTLNQCWVNPITDKYLIEIFNHFKLCLADAIHNLKWLKIIQIWPNGG